MFETPLPYSYHTFLFPFIWNDNGETKWNDFEKVLSVGKRWVETSWKKEELPIESSQNIWLQNYSAFQYFTETANNAIFNTRGDNVVRCFEYHHNDQVIKNKGEYVITKGADVFRLGINGIRLHVYDIGIAILIFELENIKNESLDAVNRINEHGRRINLPFLTPGKSHYLCADKIGIYFDGRLYSEENYIEKLVKLGENFDSESKLLSLNFVMKPIQMLIDGAGLDNGGYTITSTVSHKEQNKIYIKPCIDDRMFVCCLVRDDSLSQHLKEYDMCLNEYKYLTESDKREDEGKPIDLTLSNELYKLCFIETYVSCQSSTMKRKILRKVVYERWIDFGTVSAVTHHSFLCITDRSDDVLETVINSFLTEYIQLAILVLAQRAAILAISNEAAIVTEGFSETHVVTSGCIEKIEKLQMKYVKMQNQLLLSEVTVQEQGVELYNLIRKNLYIQDTKKELDEQMNNLRDVANISNSRLERKSDEESAKSEKKLNIILGIIAAVSLPLALFQSLSVWFDGKNMLFQLNACWQLFWVVVPLVVIIPFVYFVLKKKR